MTDQQLEAAARKLCELRGVDPDRLVPTSPPPNDMGYVPAVLLTVPAWRQAKAEIQGFLQIAQAVDSVISSWPPQ